MTRSSEDWISESKERLNRLERERLKYRSLVETTTDPDAAQRHARKLARLNNELNHLRQGIKIAVERMNNPSAIPVTEPDDDFNPDEYLDILDDAERPTEQFNANDVGPDGQKLGDMIAAAAAKRAAKLEAKRAAREAAENQAVNPSVATTSSQPAPDGGEGGPTLSFHEEDLAVAGAQGRMLMWGVLIAVLVGGVLSYVLMMN